MRRLLAIPLVLGALAVAFALTGASGESKGMRYRLVFDNAFGRPYTPDFVGWMDDFSHTGGYDANGSFSRTQTLLNAFSPSDGSGAAGALLPLPDRAEVLNNFTRTQQVKRCPGASEEPADDGSNVWSEDEQRRLDCLEEDRATGPKR